MVRLEGNTKIMEFNLSTITEATLEIGQKIDMRAAEINEVVGKPGPGSASALHKISNSTANDLIQYSDKMEGAIPKFESDMELLLDTFSAGVKILKTLPSVNPESVTQFKASIFEFMEASATTLKSIKGFKEIMSNTKGISKAMNRGISQVIKSLDKIITVMEKSEAYLARIATSLNGM